MQNLRYVLSAKMGLSEDVTKLIQGFYGGSAAGRPMQPFRAPYVEIDDKTNGNVELHTAEFKDGHTSGRSDRKKHRMDVLRRLNVGKYTHASNCEMWM